MISTKDHIKVLSTLSLANSDTREDTLISIIINTIFQKNAIKRNELGTFIKELYDFEPYKDEVNRIFEDLIQSNKILKDDNLEYKLSEEEMKLFLESDTKLKDREKSRFQNFKNFIDNIEEGIEVAQIKLLWATFVEYLYNNFYEYGEEALSKFHPHINIKNNNEDNDLDFFQIAFTKLRSEKLCSLFRETVENFSDYASSDDIDFLNDLAQKTLSFASLGINPKYANTSLDNSIIDWVLYLDTNVLYSLLNLHSHPENDACKALIHLIKDNKANIKIVLRYSELTKKELQSKKDDFSLLDEKLTDSSIKALLKSDNLDDFSKQFYSNILENRDITLHPSKVIELSSHTLLKDEIDISRNHKRIEKLGESYIDIKIQEYRRFIDNKNLFREEYNVAKKTSLRSYYRSEKQITHDISLREVIIDQRDGVLKKGTVATLNGVKYFGVTLDALLLDFDNKEVKGVNDGRSFPVFFKPSFLLNQLVKVLPIKTDDYKKAFLKAVTSKGFNKDVQKSQDVLKIVNYLKSQGIDDEKVIYNLISENIFLEKYKKSKNDPDFNTGEFIEAEINKEFKKREEELNRTKEELILKENDSKEKTLKAESLSNKKTNLESELSLYKSSLLKLHKDLKRLEKQSKPKNSQSVIEFETEEIKINLLNAKKELKSNLLREIEEFKFSSIKKWQKVLWWNLVWLVPLTILVSILIINPSYILDDKLDSTSIRTVAGLFTVIIDGLFLYVVKSRYFDEGNKQKKSENLILPENFKERLKNID